MQQNEVGASGSHLRTGCWHREVQKLSSSKLQGGLQGADDLEYVLKGRDRDEIRDALSRDRTVIHREECGYQTPDGIQIQYDTPTSTSANVSKGREQALLLECSSLFASIMSLCLDVLLARTTLLLPSMF